MVLEFSTKAVKASIGMRQHRRNNSARPIYSNIATKLGIFVLLERKDRREHDGEDVDLVRMSRQKRHRR
jgi:hypothetical protein